MCNFLFVHVNEWANIDSPDTIPISQGYILAYLKKHGYGGTILGDYKDQPLSGEQFHQALIKNPPRVVCFSTYEENINRVRVLAGYVKKINPKILVMLGGPQITFMPSQGLLQMAEVDILCRGEGERTSLALAGALREGRDLDTVPGICYRHGHGIRETAKAPLLDDLDTIPSPYLEDIFDLSRKSRAIILSSRGCSSPCTFCYTTRASEKRVRFHSEDRVIAELQYLKSKGIRDFWFADPNFAYSRERLTRLLGRIEREVKGVEFWCQTRYNLLDDALIALLKKCGGRTIAFGLESADPQVLGNIKKGLDTQKLSRVVKKVQGAGLETELFTLFGLPGESLEQAFSTLEFVRENKVAVEGNSISQQLHLFHGTPIAMEPQKHGVKPLPLTKPAYLSVCRDYETEAMGKRDIETMGLYWRLNRTDFREHVESGTNLFAVASFITRHRDRLSHRPQAELMLARIYPALEEYGRAEKCMGRLKERFGDLSEVREFLSRPFTAYKLARRGRAEPGCKIIYDCKASVDGRFVPATEAYYQDAVLGDSTLLADFEKGILGMRAGRCSQCEVEFPEDYGNRELAGKRALFQIYLQQVLTPVSISSPDSLSKEAPSNIYRFHDLDGLQKCNEKLYYLVLRDYSIRGLSQSPEDFLNLLNFYLRLGFEERAGELLNHLPADGSVLSHAGHILLLNGHPELALEMLNSIADYNAEVEADRAKALIELKRYEEAEKIVRGPLLREHVQGLDLRVGLSSLMQRPVEEYLAAMDELLDYQIFSMGELSGG